MKRAIPILFFIMLAVPALCVGKVTEDPNKPGAAAPASEELKTDAKLGQKVTYSASKKTVSAIIDELSNSTGVVIRAGRNSSDWQVRDRKMNIYAKDVPLNELMNSIARVMKFKWEISGKDGAWSYRLYMDRKSLLDAEAQRVREEKKVEDARAKKRENGLMQYGRLENLTPADKEKLRTDNPFLYFVSRSGMGSSMGAFFSESPGALEAISTGQKFEMKASALSQKAQAGLAQSMQQMLDMEAKFGGGRSSRTLPSDLASDMSGVSVRINHKMDMINGMGRGAGMLLGEMEFSYKGGAITVPMMDPDSALTKMIGKALIECEDTGRSMQDVMKDMGPELVAAVMNEMRAEAGGEAINEHPEDPALKAKIKMEAKGNSLPDIEEALSDASKLAVVSDFFGGWNMPMGQAPAGESELKEVLERIADTYTYNWDKRGSVIELRDRNWFKKRAAQIPEAWLEAWRLSMTKNGTIDIDELAQIAALTHEQISVNLMADDVLSGSVGAIYSWRELLRLYGALSPDQRSLMFTDAGLPLRSLTQDQWAQAEKAMQTRRDGATEPSRRHFIVATRGESPGKALSYKFTLIDDSKTELSSWAIMTPTYTPPAPPKEPAAKPGDAAKPAEAKPADQPKPAAVDQAK